MYIDDVVPKKETGGETKVFYLLRLPITNIIYYIFCDWTDKYNLLKNDPLIRR
jgi:hypothetical protein